MKYLYQARLLPLNKPVNVPNQNGEPWRSTFTEDTFALESASRRHPVWANHKASVVIGETHSLITRDGWWQCDFTLDTALTDELEVGQPVSISLMHVAGVPDDHPFIREVSIVPDGAVDGAEITSRRALEPAPKPEPARTQTPKAVQVIHHPRAPDVVYRAKPALPPARLAGANRATRRPRGRPRKPPARDRRAAVARRTARATAARPDDGGALMATGWRVIDQAGNPMGKDINSLDDGRPERLLCRGPGVRRESWAWGKTVASRANPLRPNPPSPRKSGPRSPN